MSNPETTWIAPGARVSPDAQLLPFVYVGSDVEIGPGTIVQPHVAILGKVRVGARVRIGAGTVIGCEGFGYEKRGEEYRLLEHNGTVAIEDDVDIGANVTIARAKTGRETRIGRGTKIDCLVHIGHNVVIGEDCIIVAQVGVSGSVRLGNRVQLAGQVGIKDHVSLGDDSVVLAKSAVFRSIPAGEHYSGIPARPHEQSAKLWARLWRQFGREK